MNLILLYPQDFIAPDTVRLTGRRHTHIRKVLQAKPGDSVTCGLVNGKTGQGRLTNLSFDQSELIVSLDQDPPPLLPLKLVLALPRPKMLKRLLQNVTSMGVKEIYLVNSWRVEKSFWQSPVLAKEKLAGYMELGLEQARDTIMPELHIKRFFARFVKNELPHIAQNTHCLTAHPKTDQPCPAGINCPATLAIGPEGGWIDLEVKTFEEIGFTSYNIGPRILTVETATTTLISRLYN